MYVKRYSSIQKARKSWKCDSCGIVILPGDRYTYEADKGSGANAERLCRVCVPIGDEKREVVAK